MRIPPLKEKETPTGKYNGSGLKSGLLLTTHWVTTGLQPIGFPQV